MRAYQTNQIVSDSHLLTVQLPPGAPTGPAQVIVLFPDDLVSPLGGPKPGAGFAGLADFARWLQAQPATVRGTADIERQIADEREAWD